MLFHVASAADTRMFRQFGSFVCSRGEPFLCCSVQRILSRFSQELRIPQRVTRPVRKQNKTKARKMLLFYGTRAFRDGKDGYVNKINSLFDFY